MRCSRILLSIWFYLFNASSAIKVVVDPDNHSYHIDTNHETVLVGSKIAVYVGGKWCVQGAMEKVQDVWPMELQQMNNLEGFDSILGYFSGVAIEWNCALDSREVVPLVTSFRNFNETAVVLDLEFPNGAKNTAFTDPKASMTNFPAFLMPTKYSYLSWHGDFIQSIRGMSEGAQGGPTVFYKSSGEDSINAIVASPWINFETMKAFTAGSNKDYKGRPAWAPGTSARIQELPPGYAQSFIFYEGTGITATLYQWGQAMQRSFEPKLQDITLSNIGYQTDNGAAYCFCKEANCSETLIHEIADLKENGVPMGYLSFQGAGTSSGRGQAAPWCVETWGVDGGLNVKQYPLSVKDMQEAIDIPIQLYSPYFCPTTKYFDNPRRSWSAVASDTTLPGCKDYDFRDVKPEQSEEFYGWYMDKGIKAGMKSFETDFMNQNYNCVPDFIQSASAGDTWLKGMADAALQRNITIQWCYGTPTDVLASIRMPSVTQFRVSFDFCYGRSWNIGESSLLVWALGAAPSKDTLWTSDNGKLETPGCSWTVDHEEPAAELHLVLALMSTGPVGISDAIGQTNFTMAKRAIRSDGVLLKPLKAITAVDTSFLKEPGSSYLYSTIGLGSSWIYVSFLSEDAMTITKQDFWPGLDHNSDLVYRHFHSSGSCTHDSDAIVSSCITGRIAKSQLLGEASNLKIPMAPPHNYASPYAPRITYVWQNCIESKWFLLGELDKYVPLSPARFKKLNCTASGMSTIVIGAPEETIELTALEPKADGSYKVVVVTFVLPKSGELQVDFETSTME